MTTAADVVAEARSWLGTPFKWQASLKGVGCDCKGLIWGVARELGLPEAESAYAGVADYDSRVPVQTLLQGLAETFQRVGEPQPGDVLLIITGSPKPKPQHLAIHAGERMIHTFDQSRRRQVISSPLVASLRHWPLHSAWRFASLEA